ncbi:MAG: hypothetical protein ACP5KB_05070 [Thermoprotei archaeon]
MSTKCYEDEIGYKCVVRTSNTALVVENLEMLGEVKRISLKNVKEIIRHPNERLEIRTSEGDIIRIALNELIAKDIKHFVFLYYFTKEQQRIMDSLERNLHNYVFLISQAFRILQSLTKGNVPQWESYKELIERLQDFNYALSVLGMNNLSETLSEYTKAFASSIEKRSVASLIVSLRNYVKFLTTYFSSLLREIIKDFDFSYFIDLTLIVYIYFYSKSLGLPLQAEKARVEFEHLVQEQISKFSLHDETLKERIKSALKLLLQTSRSPEEVPQRLIEVFQEEINRYVLQSPQ